VLGHSPRDSEASFWCCFREPHAFICGMSDCGCCSSSKSINSRGNLGKLGIVCRLDLEKPSDYPNWEFLIYLMRQVGFGEGWIRIFSTSFAVLVN